MAINPDGLQRLKQDDSLVLLVPGFLTQIYSALGRHAESELNRSIRLAARKVGFIGRRIAKEIPPIELPFDRDGLISFRTQMREFKALGIEFTDMTGQAGFNTQGSFTDNARAINTVLATHSGRKVVILSHSKGGLDTLEALRVNRPVWKVPVVGWVSLQAPFFGSPIADQVPDAFAEHLLEALGGDERALREQTVADRRRYMRENEDTIRRLAGSIPIRSCYTTYRPSPAGDIGQAAFNFAEAVFTSTLMGKINRVLRENLTKNLWRPWKAIKPSVKEAISLINDESNRLIHRTFDPIGVLDLVNVAISQLAEELNDGLVPEASAKLPAVELRELKPDADHAAPVLTTAPFREFWTASQRNDVTLELLAEVAAEASEA